ncbi:YbaB/EbfC family nucleoid-associated protein [Microbacterium sp. Marseille-Q6965]|uniref:YbaB/EbfC family nucleoid-associated protein n=1 Tax=Microbacterium sp. Marseille-Q6965 TaxID=2965072 RepID=UPI0021B79E8E|nr:YbaB/EbfC family nucleoid-associated protein [Microbacterium sp. Marseille-Q6965]
MDQTDDAIGSSFETARARLDEIVRRAEQNRQRAHALADDVRQVTAEARSTGGEVVVRAGVGGRVETIEFGDEAEEMTLDDLAQLTVRTVAEAQHAAMATLAERAGRVFGGDSEIAERMRRDADSAYPPPASGSTSAGRPAL